MKIFRKLFDRSSAKAEQDTSSRKDSLVFTSSEYITESASGENLVDGKQPWELADEHKDDLDVMLSCCNAELSTMRTANIVAAPFYFERAAILLRKAGKLQDEIDICEEYISAVEEFYSGKDLNDLADVRIGPRFQAISKRLCKARDLIAKSVRSA